MATVLAASFGLGLLGSGGPCSAARVLSCARLLEGRRPLVALLSFALGAATIDVLLVGSLGLFSRVMEFADWWYGAAAFLCAVFGVRALFLQPNLCSLSHSVDDAGRPFSLWKSFSLGAGGGLLLSSCCAPFLAGAATLAASGGSSAPVLSVLAFAIGHLTLPISFACLTGRLTSPLTSLVGSEALQIVQAGVYLGCGTFFAVLA